MQITGFLAYSFVTRSPLATVILEIHVTVAAARSQESGYRHPLVLG